jgi:protein-tyrosine phosphatase
MVNSIKWGDGRRKLEAGRQKMGDGSWKTADGRRTICDVNAAYHINYLFLRALPSSSSYFLLPSYLCGMKILMVCLGNICRSPLAEGILQHKAFKAGLNWSVESAGTNGYHTGEAPHHLSIKVAKMNGIDISMHRSRKFTEADFEQYDIIYAMAADVLEDMRRIAKNKFDGQKAILILNEIYPGQNKDVPDPWYGPEAGYHDVFALIEKACDKIVSSQ